ncbi:hypothetical protein L914_12781 [Phytophthora nicotianae]|uniref:RXLR phytopathogen effector protein WY-domain domain-containing protein n=1 Tax=Phytophthora nicotianae TaxID=4792 RepID=W2N0L2_PHYNI|nr:hypothetical protein L914_12781 [Phytophthora nicotianae]
MNYQRIWLLLVAVFLPSLFAQTPIGQVHKTKVNDLDAVVKTNSITSKTPTSSNRVLRLRDASVRDTVGGDNGSGEERVNTHALSRIDDLIHKLFKSNPEKAQIKAWVNSDVHPKMLFDVLRLGKGTAKLDDDPNFLAWLQLVAAFRAKNGEQAFSDLDIYYLLLKTKSAEELSNLLESLQKVPAFKKLAASMQKSLSGTWIPKTLEHETNPSILFDTLRLRDAGAKLGDSPIFHQWLYYVEKYRAKRGDHWFGDIEMLALFRKTMPEDEVVLLIHKIRNIPGMKNHGDTMQRFLFLTSKTSQKTMNEVWLKFQVPPEEVFRILALSKARMDGLDDNTMLIHWLRYIKLYRGHTKTNVFASEQTVLFLTKAKPFQSEWEFATLFQSLKDVPDLKPFAENMQSSLFLKWLRMEFDPNQVSHFLTLPYPTNAVRLPKSHPVYRTWESYTLYFTKRKGGEPLLKKVKALFDNDNPTGALTAVMKAQ